MTNRELQFIMSLKDEFSASWQRAVGNAQASLARLRSQLDAFRGLLAGAFSVAALKGFIDASNEQELATAKLTQALKTQGITSSAVTKEMEAFSSQLQKVTIYGDESITNLQAMLVAMTGLSGKGVQPLTVAALDLASGLNVDIETAGKLIAKTLEGQDALGRYGIVIGKAGSQSERLAAITKEVEKRFGGMAEAAGNTAAGKIKQFQNAIDDLQERFGDIVKRVLFVFLPMLERLVSVIESAPVPIQAMVLAVGALTAAFVALNIPLAGIPLIIGTVVVGLTGLAAWLGTTSNESQTLRTELSGIRGELANTAALDGMIERYKVLSNQTKLTRSEKAELSRITKELAAAIPEAVVQFDEEGKAIKLSYENLKAYNAEKQRTLEMQERERREQLSEELRRQSLELNTLVERQRWLQRTIAASQPMLEQIRASLGEGSKAYGKISLDLTKYSAELESNKARQAELKKAIEGLNEALFGTEAVAQGVRKAITDTSDATKAAAGSLTYFTERYNELLKKLQATPLGTTAFFTLKQQVDDAWLSMKRAESLFNQIMGKTKFELKVTTLFEKPAAIQLPELKPLDPSVLARINRAFDAVRDSSHLTRRQWEAINKLAPGLSSQLEHMADRQALIAQYGEEWVKEIEAAELRFKIAGAVADSMVDVFRSNFIKAWNDIFSEANSLLEQFFQKVAEKLLEIAAMKVAFAIFGLFHEGGTVPKPPKAHSGAFVDTNGALRGLSFANIPSSKEFPILVRGGETIRTEMQEQHLQRLIAQAQAIINSYQPPSASRLNVPSSSTMPAAVASHTTTNRTEIHLHITGPVVGRAEWILEGFKEGLRKTGLTVDKLVVDNRNNLKQSI